MVRHVEESGILQGIIVSFNWSVVVSCFRNGFVEMRDKGLFVVSTCSEVFEESLKAYCPVVFCCTECVDSVNNAMDHTGKESGWVA